MSQGFTRDQIGGSSTTPPTALEDWFDLAGWKLGWVQYGASSSSLGTVITNTGTITPTPGDATEPAYGDYITTAVSGNQSLIQLDSVLSSANELAIVWYMRMTTQTLVAVHMGFGNGTSIQQMAAGSNIDMAMFRFDSSLGDTNWMLVTRDGSTLITPIDSGVAADNSKHTFAIIGNAGGTAFNFYIDGVLVGIATANLPRTNQVLRHFNGVRTNTAGIKNAHFYSIALRSR